MTPATLASRPHPLDHRLPPPALGVLVGAAMWLASRLGPVVDLGLAVRAAVGAAVVALGWSLVAWGFLTFRAQATTIDPVHLERTSALVTWGPFARSRNPMYVGFTVMLVGWALALGSPLALAGPALFAAYLTRFQIRPEERALAARFGEAFASYARRVPRWL